MHKAVCNAASLVPDPRTKDFLFVSSPVPLLVIMFVYHRFVQSWGPAFMANRQPYNVKNLIIVYNIIQIALSIFLTTQVSSQYFYLALTFLLFDLYGSCVLIQFPRCYPCASVYPNPNSCY